MEYTALKLKSQLHGLSVKRPNVEGPIGQRTAIIENLGSLVYTHPESGIETSEYTNKIMPVLKEIEQNGIKNIILNLSNIPTESKWKWLFFYEGTLTALGFEKTAYTGIKSEEVGSAGRVKFRGGYIESKITDSLDAAVERLI